eukprot:357338-Chlamydomonas_euryale.AAC.1
MRERSPSCGTRTRLVPRPKARLMPRLTDVDERDGALYKPTRSPTAPSGSHAGACDTCESCPLTTPIHLDPVVAHRACLWGSLLVAQAGAPWEELGKRGGHYHCKEGVYNSAHDATIRCDYLVTLTPRSIMNDAINDAIHDAARPMPVHLVWITDAALQENGVKPEYGLADLGKKQALEAGALLKERLASSPSGLSKLVVYSSPFSRTIQTAQGVLEGAGIPETPIQRGFGTVLETKSALDGYNKTWEQDAKDTAYKAGSLEGSDDGESVDDVSARVRSMFKGFEEAHEDMNILLVSHGDTLSIMQATMEEGDRKQHTSAMSQMTRCPPNMPHAVCDCIDTVWITALQTCGETRIPSGQGPLSSLGLGFRV